jgi:hypothetical protein
MTIVGVELILIAARVVLGTVLDGTVRLPASPAAGSGPTHGSRAHRAT